MMKNLCMIACVSQDGGLGHAGELLWHIPEDLQFFRETTIGGTVIMGRKTFESIGHRLPGRENIVLSRQSGKADDVKWCNLDQLGKLLDTPGQKFIIGGASLYEMFLPRAEVIYLTEVQASRPADVFFPQFDRHAWSRQVLKSGTHENINYEIVKYTRKGR